VRFALGIDIGGTNLVAGAVAEDGSSLIGLRTEPTRAEEGADAVVQRLLGMARAAIAQLRFELPDAEIVGVGVGAPGPLDRGKGVVLLTPNLGWVNLPLRDIIQTGLGVAATLDNDANCATLGEWWRGAARGASHAIGHTTIEVDGRKCGCGNYGCLEAYASGPAIARRAVEAVESGVPSRLAEYCGGSLSRVTAQTVYRAAKDGDELAEEVVHDTAKFLGVGVANMVNIFNPEVVVVFGGVTQAGDTLFVPLRREVARRAFKPAVAVCRIVPAELTGTAGVYGAARSFLDGRA